MDAKFGRFGTNTLDAHGHCKTHTPSIKPIGQLYHCQHEPVFHVSHGDVHSDTIHLLLIKESYINVDLDAGRPIMVIVRH